MNTIKNFRSLTFSRAWSMHRETGKSFSVCLAIAWRAYNLVKKMKSEIVEFTFEKVDGTLRRAKGTIQSARERITESTRKPNFKSITFFDTERNEYRSFRTENLISIH